jgi:hypothetical protein
MQKILPSRGVVMDFAALFGVIFFFNFFGSAVVVLVVVVVVVIRFLTAFLTNIAFGVVFLVVRASANVIAYQMYKLNGYP